MFSEKTNDKLITYIIGILGAGILYTSKTSYETSVDIKNLKVAQKKLRVVERVAPKIRKKVVVKRKDAPKKRKASKRKVAKKKMSVPKKIGGMRTAAFGFLVTGIFELVMAMPVIGWLIGVGSFGIMWVIGIVINIVVIVALINRKKPIYANIVAIVANVLGIVPFLGWLLHLIATVLLFVLFFKEERKNC